MPGESPGRNWDALLTPPSVEEAFAAARARHRRKRKLRTWTVILYLTLGTAIIGWFASLFLLFVHLPIIFLLLWMVAFPLLMVGLYFILQPFRRVVVPDSEWELVGEE